MEDIDKAVKELMFDEMSPTEYDESREERHKNLNGAMGEVTLDDESQVKHNQSQQAQRRDLDEAVEEVRLARKSQSKHDQSQHAQNKNVDRAFENVTFDEMPKIEHHHLQQAENAELDSSQGEVMFDDESQVEHTQSHQEAVPNENTQPKFNVLNIANQKLAIKAIHDNDPSKFVWLFEIGMSPQCCTQRIPEIDASLLEEAIFRNSYDVLKVLLDNKVNVNDMTNPKLKDDPDFCCQSIMSLVLQDDDPTLMELFLPKYERRYNWEGKSLLYMACQLGAFRCVEVLLQRHRGDANLAEISFNDRMKNKAMIISLLCRTEGAVYTPDDLGFCLKQAVSARYIFGHCSLFNRYEGDRLDYVNLLLTCGANVNLEFPSITENFTSLEELLYLPGPPQTNRFVENALSLLLCHGAIANWQSINIMLFWKLIGVIYGHEQEEMRLLFLSIMSKLYSKEHFTQIKGPMVDCEIGQRSSEWSTLLQAEVRDVSSKSEQKNDCILNPEIIRLGILYLDISVRTLLRYERKWEINCRCRKYYISLVVSTLKHSDYQEFIKEILSDNEGRFHWLDAVQFSNPRSLKESTRATILNSLCFPRSLSIKELPLPKCLEAYLCLKYL